jgi:hypothetical protein
MINASNHSHAQRVESQLLKQGWRKPDIDRLEEALTRKLNGRVYPGEETARALIGFLNDLQSPNESKRRIERLLAEASRREATAEPVTRRMTEKMLRVLSIEKLADAPDALQGAPFPDRPRDGYDGAFKYTSWKIASLLGAYKLTPVFIATVNGRWIIDWYTPSKRTRSEATAVLKVLDLGARGLLSKVKRCKDPDCPLWFYQRSSHNRFHSLKCQQHFFRADPNQREKHAEEMRLYRLSQKRRKEREDRVWQQNRRRAKGHNTPMG